MGFRGCGGWIKSGAFAARSHRNLPLAVALSRLQGVGWSRIIVTQQNLLDRAAVCSRLLHKTSNPKDRLMLWQLRELWSALAVDGLHQKDLDEQVEALRDAEAKLLTEITPALH